MQSDEIRGHRAKQLLDDDLLQESLQTIEDDVVERWKATAQDAAREREDLWHQYSAVRTFREKLANVMETGKVEAIKRKRSPLEYLGFGGGA